MIWLLPAIVASQVPLTPLLKTCPTTARENGDCAGDVFRPIWRRFEADNGEVTKVNMARISRLPGGGASAWLYTYAPGTAFMPGRLEHVMFDCRGTYQVMGGESGDAPPRSVIGAVAAAVCSKAKM